jgi:hypothetical protein
MIQPNHRQWNWYGPIHEETWNQQHHHHSQVLVISKRPVASLSEAVVALPMESKQKEKKQ